MGALTTNQYLKSPHPTRGINVLTPIEGKQAGLSVESVSVDYNYDDTQRIFENGETDAIDNPIDKELGEKQSEGYKRKRIQQYMNINYAGKDQEKVFPHYHEYIKEEKK